MCTPADALCTPAASGNWALSATLCALTQSVSGAGNLTVSGGANSGSALRRS